MRHRRRWRRNHHLCSNKCKCLLRFRNRPLLRRQVSIRHRLWTRHRRRLYRLEVEVVRRAVDLHPRRRRRHRTRQPRRLHRRILRHLRLRHHRCSSSNRFSKLRPSNSFNTKRHHLCNNNNNSHRNTTKRFRRLNNNNNNNINNNRLARAVQPDHPLTLPFPPFNPPTALLPVRKSLSA